MILIFLQGGPSHLDLWDPKDDVPDDVRSAFKTIPSKVAGMEVTELLPELAKVTDKLTLIRSMSYTPNGLFNHTAAHYQMLTGYTADKVSPSGQLEPPSPKDFPHLGCNIIKLKPPEVPMLPLVMMPRPPQESNVVGKASTAGFLGREFDPYTLYPPGDDLNETKMDNIKVEDLALRPELSVARLERRVRLRDTIGKSMPALEKAVEKHQLDEYTAQALDLVLSGRARQAFNLDDETDELRDRYGRTTFGQSCLLARRFVEAGTRFVQVNWPKVANSDRHSWDVHVELKKRMGEMAGPSPRKGLSTSGNANDKDGRDHWPYCFTAVVAGAGVKRGSVYGKSDETASAPVANPVHPTDLLATIYHAVGLRPDTLVYNHLNQPREMVKGNPVLDLFA